LFVEIVGNIFPSYLKQFVLMLELAYAENFSFLVDLLLTDFSEAFTVIDQNQINGKLGEGTVLIYL
jgi:hypothetical protein